MVVQSAVADQKGVRARDLAMDDAGDVDAGFPHQITPQFDEQFGSGQFAAGPFDDAGEMGTDWRQVKRLLAWEVGDAKTAAEGCQNRRRG